MTGKERTYERKENQLSVLISSGLGVGLKQVLNYYPLAVMTLEF